MSALVLAGAALGGFDWQDADIGEKDAAMEVAYSRGEFALSAELDTQIWFDGPNRTPDQVDADIRARVYEMVLRCHQLPEPVEAKRIGIEPTAIERLAELMRPALVLVGDEDVAVWTDVLPMAQLVEMWPLAELLAGAHHVVSYWQILANIEPMYHMQMGNILSFWFGQILKLRADD